MNAGEWIDVSVPVRDGMLHWPGDREVAIGRRESIDAGDEANLTELEISAHTGTHMDAPVHFLPDGAGIDELPLDAAIGPARVVEIADPEAISVEEIASHEPRRGERLLVKTRNSSRAWWQDDFTEGFVHIDPDAAARLAEVGLRLVGVDYLSVGGMQAGAETHRHLLGAGIWIIEGLDLTAIEPGDYELCCLPLRIVGADGAPARALLRPSG